jgi:phosphoribosylaminoimidazolecarboxamide formyltransferase / IMP cyclohydrolase
MQTTKIERALVSVTDKTIINKFCKGLDFLGVEILSTGGTANTLRQAQIEVKEVSEFTKFPEIFSGRLKTIHPKIAGGLLFDRNNALHVEQAKKNGIKPIDMVVVNLYQFIDAIKKGGKNHNQMVELIDIGGVGLIRAAAKNYKYVTVVTDINDYKMITDEMKKFRGQISERTNFFLAMKAFQLTAQYDVAISAYMALEFCKL